MIWSSSFNFAPSFQIRAGYVEFARVRYRRNSARRHVVPARRIDGLAAALARLLALRQLMIDSFHALIDPKRQRFVLDVKASKDRCVRPFDLVAMAFATPPASEASLNTQPTAAAPAMICSLTFRARSAQDSDTSMEMTGPWRSPRFHVISLRHGRLSREAVRFTAGDASRRSSLSASWRFCTFSKSGCPSVVAGVVSGGVSSRGALERESGVVLHVVGPFPKHRLPWLLTRRNTRPVAAPRHRHAEFATAFRKGDIRQSEILRELGHGL